ncbi:MAG: NADH-quinone oxidoreductase subunit NuoG [Gammaproteobacteria bacterium]
MIDIEINGMPIRARDGAMVIEAADEAGIAIPRFCYHKKLPVSANCRMCLVDIDKAAKPLPACATPATDGMKIFTNSPKAIMAQKGVMEFLLINHPLDCPICDQGGECQLQDVAMGYGRDVSRYQENKRVVKDKNLGPLIATDMTRCIHCMRCVLFGQHIAGVMELGATGRGEHMEIGTFVEQSINSEMSGNVIDLCPVGALTSKPYRYTARTWELSQHETIAPHDSIGSNLYLHVRGERVMRVVPHENEAINEVWISDRDRFSYQGINSPDRLHAPMLKRNGKWQEVDWQTALEATVQGLNKIIAGHGAGQIGALVSPTATLEEMYLLQKIIRGIGCANIDHRLRQSDFSNQEQAPLSPSLGISIEALEQLDAVLLIGSNVRNEQPIIAHRLRKAALNGASVMLINPVDYELHFKVQEKIIAGPAGMLEALVGVARILAQVDSTRVPPGLEKLLTQIEPDERHLNIAKHLKEGAQAIVLLGNLSLHHPHYSLLEILASYIATETGATFGTLPEAANSVGGWIAGVLPHRAAAGQASTALGLDAASMFNNKLKAYVLLGLEPEFDSGNPSAALKALEASEFTVSLTAFRSDAIESYADVMLPIAAFAETSGTYVNAESRWQSFTGAVTPQGEARPAWKILRVLGNLFNVHGFEYISSDEVRDELHAIFNAEADRTSAGDTTEPTASYTINKPAGLMRLAEVPPYAADGLVRRAEALQQTIAARPAALYINASVAANLGLVQGDLAVAEQDGAQSTLPVVIDARIPDGCVLIPVGLPQTTTLGTMFGPVAVTRYATHNNLAALSAERE